MCAITAQTDLKYDKTNKKNSIAKVLAERIVKQGELFTANYNTWIGMSSFVITGNEPEYYQSMTFGFQPPWAAKSMLLFNARAEGKEGLQNGKSHLPGIFEMPAFREPIREQRCVIPVDYFIEGTESRKLEEPFLVEQKDHEILLLAGIWQTWTNPNNGQEQKGFAIITTEAAPLMRSIGHHRSPLRLTENTIDSWLSEGTSPNELSSILSPANFEDCQAFPIDPIIKSRRNSKDVIRKRLSLFD